MATILRSYDWSVVSRNNKRARSRSYPWDDWFDGRIWELHPGEDFDGPATSLERVIRTTANRREVKVRIRIDNKNVVLQQHDGEEPLRTVTKSPSRKAVLARKAAAASPSVSGNGTKPVKAVAKRAARPVTKSVGKVSKVPAKRVSKRLASA